MMPFSVAGCGRLQLEVAHWPRSDALLQGVEIDSTISDSRFSARELLAIEEDFGFLPLRV